MLNRTQVSGQRLLILLVEDNPAHAELVKRSLQEQRVGYQITHLSDGEQAVEYLFQRGDYADKRKHPRPHIILLDLRLPRLDGLDVLRQIKTADEEAIRRIPVVVLTTSEAEQDLVQAYDCHANSYVVKPLNFEGFTALMEDLGYYWRQWNYYPWS
ncbi:MAG: response regulator [Rhodothermales bacterium]